MSDPGSAVVARLELNPAFWTPIGGRVDWTVSLPETPCPRCVLTFVGGDRPDMAEGPDMVTARLQIDVYSTLSAGEAAELVEQATASLIDEATAEGWRFTRALDVGFPTDGGDQTETGYQYRSRQDMMLMLAPTDAPDSVLIPIEWAEAEW